MATITITNNTEFTPELAVEFAKADDIKYDYGCCLYHGGEDLLDVLTELYYTVTEEMDANASDNLLKKTENILDMLHRERDAPCTEQESDTDDGMRYLVYYYTYDDDVAVKVQAVFHDVDDALEFHSKHQSDSATLVPMVFESEEYRMATTEIKNLLP